MNNGDKTEHQLVNYNCNKFVHIIVVLKMQTLSIQSLRKFFMEASAHYQLFTQFTPSSEVNNIFWLKSEAAVITFLN